MTLFLVPALLALAIWLGLLMGRHGFWRADQVLPSLSRFPGRKPPQIVAIVPARDEAATILQSIGSILAQDYAGLSHVILVDDHSADATAQLAQTHDDPRLHVMQARDLPKGWAGKMWAVSQGVDKARELAPTATYCWLTDADIAHGPSTLSRLAAQAEDRNASLVSLMARLNCTGIWERLLIPAFVFFFQKLYPFSDVNNPLSSTAAAAGGCMLVRKEALESAGGIQAIRDRIIDDCALASILKPQGPIWLGLAQSDESKSLRPYPSLASIWSMVARTAFVQLRHSWLLLAGAVAGMLLLYVVPPVALALGIISGNGFLTLSGTLGWLCMTIAYLPTMSMYGLKPAIPWALTLPLSGLMYALMTVDSGLRRGAAWKGRSQGGGFADPDSDRASLQMAAEIVEKAGTSFYWAMRTLPEERRQAMFAIYAFCRAVDDIADSQDAPEIKRQGLARWRQGIQLVFEGKDLPEDMPLLRALRAPIRRYALRQVDFEAIIDGMEMDAGDPIQAPTREIFDQYIDRVACAVGRLSNRVMGAPVKIADSLANSLGKALQITNILRDLAEDAELSRLYLPSNVLAKCRIQERDPTGVLAHPHLQAVCLILSTEAKNHFTQAAALMASTDSRPLRPALSMMAVYKLILERLIDRGWSNPAAPLKISKGEKLWAALHGALSAGPPTS
ncbi:Squalene-phytoene synthase [Rhodospirillaceae bacterium LM-1]|nr:Squalene-phytoene synthase [Rhodospirillaceae bacterium LM-1]